MNKEAFLEYLKKLYKEYQASKGITEDTHDMLGNQDYLNYLKEVKHDLELYKQNLMATGVLSNIVLELDKGFLDSVSSKELPFILLTNYNETFEEERDDKREIIKGNLVASSKGVNIKFNNVERTLTIFRDSNLYCVIQNPFDYKKAFEDLKLLHIQGFSVVLGIFGKLSDKNYQEKMAKLNSFQKLVSGSILTRNIEDTYVAYVKTKGNDK